MGQPHEQSESEAIVEDRTHTEGCPSQDAYQRKYGQSGYEHPGPPEQEEAHAACLGWGVRHGKIQREMYGGCGQKGQRHPCCGEGAKSQHRRICSSRQDRKSSRKAKSPWWRGRKANIRKER